MTGFFILPGRIDVPFMYKVRRVRDGGVYCLRSVEVYQMPVEESSGSRDSTTEEQISGRPRQTEAMDVTPCFTATASFKRREDPAKHVDFRYQTPQVSAGHIRRTYASVLHGRKPEDQPTAPGADAMWWTRGVDADVWTEAAQVFPGVDIRKVDMNAYNHGLGSPDQAGEWRQLSFYKLIKDDEDEHDSDDETSTFNLHACAHLYASDRNSLFLTTRALGFEDQIVAMSSLSHTVIFHGDPQSMRMCDKKGRATWFLQEAWTENGGLNRGCHESRLWTCRDDGLDEIIATTNQDGMVRVPADSISIDEILEERKSRMEKFGKGKL
jgi:acyl-CoA thioesterase